MRLLPLLLVVGSLPAWALPPGGAAGPPVSAAPPATQAPTRVGEHPLDTLQDLVRSARLDAWLLCQHGADTGATASADADAAADLLALRSAPLGLWCLLLPAAGEVQLLVAHDDSAVFTAVPGRLLRYRQWRERDQRLRTLLQGRRRVAFDIARIDGATVDKLRIPGVTFVPDADLRTQALARWSTAARLSHARAQARLVQLKDLAFRFIAQRLAARAPIDERIAQQHIERSLASLGLATALPIVVAAGRNTADPHYQPSDRQSSEIRLGDLIRIALAAREQDVPEAVYATLTWMGVASDAVSPRAQAAFSAVRKARDEALKLIAERHAKKTALLGWEVDAQVHQVIHDAAADLQLLTPLPSGHSLGPRPRGNGPSFDDTDTHDQGRVFSATAYTLAPAAFLAGELGVATSVDLYLDDNGHVAVLPASTQQDIEPLFAPSQAAPTVPGSQ